MMPQLKMPQWLQLPMHHIGFFYYYIVEMITLYSIHDTDMAGTFWLCYIATEKLVLLRIAAALAHTNSKFSRPYTSVKTTDLSLVIDGKPRGNCR